MENLSKNSNTDKANPHTNLKFSDSFLSGISQAGTPDYIFLDIF